MNAHVQPPHTVNEFRSWAYHMLKSRARAHEYRRDAAEAERRGRLEQYHRAIRNAEDSWVNAKFALRECRYLKQAMNKGALTC